MLALIIFLAPNNFPAPCNPGSNPLPSNFSVNPPAALPIAPTVGLSIPKLSGPLNGFPKYLSFNNLRTAFFLFSNGLFDTCIFLKSANTSLSLIPVKVTNLSVLSLVAKKFTNSSPASSLSKKSFTCFLFKKLNLPVS